MKRRPSSCAAVLLTALLGLSGCSPVDDSPTETGSSPAATLTQEVTEEDSADRADSAEGQAGDLSLLDRITPVARVKNATDIRVEGNHAWVSVPTESTSATSVLDCLQLLPALTDGEETLTVIFADGVEEECAWPEED